MKRTARVCVSAGCLLLLIALFFGFKRAIFAGRIPQSAVFTFDTSSSQQFQNDVNEFSHRPDAQSADNPSAYCDALKKQFPLIRSLEAEWAASGSFFVTVTMAKPVCFVNGDIIIAAPGIKGVPQSYEQAVCEPLPRLTCAGEHLQSWPAEKICSLALALSSCVIDNYDIVLGDYPELNLINKQQLHLRLQARADLFDAPDILRRADAVYALLNDRGAFAGKKQRQWVADMRFVQQIVLKAN